MMSMRKVALKDTRLLFPAIVVLVTSIGKKGKPNIIALDYAMRTSHKPPMVAIGVQPSRYSHKLLEEVKEFTLAIPTREILKEVNYCGSHSGRKVDKFKETELTLIPATEVETPLIEECAVNLECKIVDKLPTGDHTLFVGEVVAAHVKEEMLDEERRCLNLDTATVLIDHANEYRAIGKVVGRQLTKEVEIIE